MFYKDKNNLAANTGLDPNLKSAYLQKLYPLPKTLASFFIIAASSKICSAFSIVNLC